MVPTALDPLWKKVQEKVSPGIQKVSGFVYVIMADSVLNTFLNPIYAP